MNNNGNTGRLRVTELADQFWCEKQMELNRLYKPPATASMRQGSAQHQVLEMRINPHVSLAPKSYDDWVYTSLYKSYVALQNLKVSNTSRELHIYGMIDKYKVAGKIDQLSMRNGKVEITEDKFGSAGDGAYRQAKLARDMMQAMLYRYLVDQIVAGRYTVEHFLETQAPKWPQLSHELLVQIDKQGIEPKLRTISGVAREYFAILTSLELSDTLNIRYINKFGNNRVDMDSVVYKSEQLLDRLNFALGYWNGAREAQPVAETEKWKCEMCRFFGKECTVWWEKRDA